MLDVELSDDMVRQIEAISGKPEGELRDPSLKFDGKGSLHLMYHDDDGKLKHDTKIETMEVKSSYKAELEQELRLSQESVVKQSKRLNTIFGVFIGILALLVILSICIVISVR